MRVPKTYREQSQLWSSVADIQSRYRPHQGAQEKSRRIRQRIITSSRRRRKSEYVGGKVPAWHMDEKGNVV